MSEKTPVPQVVPCLSPARGCTFWARASYIRDLRRPLPGSPWWRVLVKPTPGGFGQWYEARIQPEALRERVEAWSGAVWPD